MSVTSHRVSLKQMAYTYIKEQILNCRYEPGSFLNEQLICDETKVSRTPVRDALIRLEQEGLVTILPKKGVMVTPLQLNDINNIYEVRMMLEPYALREYGDRIDLKRLRAVVRQANIYHANPEKVKQKETFYELDDLFHACIMDVLPNPFLRDLYRTVCELNQRLRVLSGDTVANRMEATCKEHCCISDACEAKDWQKAAAFMAEHLRQSRLAAFQLLMNAGSLKL